MDKEAIEEYSRLKKELASRYINDRNAYTAEKNDFIESILAKAKEELS